MRRMTTTNIWEILMGFAVFAILLAQLSDVMKRNHARG